MVLFFFNCFSSSKSLQVLLMSTVHTLNFQCSQSPESLHCREYSNSVECGYQHIGNRVTQLFPSAQLLVILLKRRWSHMTYCNLIATICPVGQSFVRSQQIFTHKHLKTQISTKFEHDKCCFSKKAFISL